MEPVTHILTGACMARAMGMHRRIRHATLTMAIAAEIPDADYVYRAGGPLTYFQHHRGWTHSFVWMPVCAAVTLAIVYAWHRWRKRQGREEKELPLRWAALFGLALIALCSHILLDWTNNYGVRPLAPFNPSWFQGEIVFIFEPVIFLLLLLALVLAPVFRLTDSEVGSTRVSFAGQRLAAAALVCVLAVWGWRKVEHDKAMKIAEQAELLNDAPILRVALNPLPINPFRWSAVIETPNFFQTGMVDVRTGTMTISGQDVFWKAPVTPAMMAAKTSRLGRAYLDWSRWPLVDETGREDGLQIVRFRDLRFMYDTAGFRGREKAPLSAAAFVNPQGRVVREEVNGDKQKVR